MARRLDPETRRRTIAEAVLTIAARDGLDAASVRDVATEAGVSAGMVQHYFRSRDEMLQFACDYMVDRTGRLTRERIATLPEPRSIRDILRAIFEQMLPLDEERRVGIRIWMAFLARAVVRDDLGAFFRQTHENTHRMFVSLLQQAQEHGEIPPDSNPGHEAVTLFALVDGLVSHVLLGHYSGEEALQAIDEQLDRVFGTESD